MGGRTAGDHGDQTEVLRGGNPDPVGPALSLPRPPHRSMSPGCSLEKCIQMNTSRKFPLVWTRKAPGKEKRKSLKFVQFVIFF